jgi:Ca2+-binding EF-hand superfamily protein
MKLPDFTSKELEELREAFDIFDKQNRGVCDINQMIKYCRDLHVDQKYITVFKLLVRMQTEFPKGVSFREFTEHL